MHRRVLPPACLLAPMLALIAACGIDAEGDAHGDPADLAGLATTIDSTSHPDSVFARPAGRVDSSMVRRVVEELRIAPEADDTSLFAEVSEFDVGRDGRLFVYDRAGNVLFLFDSAGRVVRRIGRQGAGPGEFNSNNGMTVLPDGRLAQWDARNARVSFFSADGGFTSSWVVPSGFSTSNGLRSDDAGNVLLHRPVTAPREGEILGRMGLVRLKDGGAIGDSLVAPDLPVERVTYLAQAEGNSSSTSPTHSARFLWQWHPHGYFVSANGGKYEIELSRPDSVGGPLRIVRDAAVVSVPDEERAWDQERVTHQMRSNFPSWVWRGPAIPDMKPPVGALQVGRDGSIWVRVATPSERIPEAELEPQRPNASPRAIFRDPLAYEVFDTEGIFRGRVDLPPRSTWIEADGNSVWYLQRDEDGLPAVVRARVTPGMR
jgi:hypothetical protein